MILKNGLSISVLVSCFIFLLSCSSLENLDPKVTRVVLLAGQSNMAGKGNFDALDEKTKQRVKKAASKVFVINGANPPEPLSYKSRERTPKYPFERAFGPELLVGVMLAERYPNNKILLIKHSRGGTSLEGAWNPNWDAKKAKDMEKGPKQSVKLYKEHTQFIKENLSQLESINENYEVIGLVWVQGENDAKTMRSANNYKANLEQLVAAYRQEFNQKMPIVFLQTNSRYGKKGAAAVVRQQMADYPKIDANSIMISTRPHRPWLDFPKHSDNVHYNAEGQKRIGEALGAALIKLQNQQ